MITKTKTSYIFKLFFSCIAFLLFAINGFSQTTDSVIIANHYSSGEGLLLKWFPTSFDEFKKGYEHGYILSRAEVLTTATGGEKLSEFIQLSKDPIKHWSQEKFTEEMKQDSSIEAAYLFINGADEIIHPEVQITAQEAIEQRKGQEMVALIGAFSAIVSNKVADALGLYFVDKTYDPLGKYVYKLQNPGYSDISFTILVYPYQENKKPKVMGASYELQQGAVNLKWYNNKNRNFPYYNIYRSVNENKGWLKLNALPYTGIMGDGHTEKEMTTFLDSFPEYNKTYYYKIVGVNAFEVEGSPSDILKVQSYYLLKSRPLITKTTTLNESDIEITWDVYPDDKPYVTGYTIKRAIAGTGPYKTITQGKLPAKTLSFTDKTPKINSNYYVVCAYGATGDSICSLLRGHMLIDSIPPSIPKFVSGECDTNGIVTLTWNKPPEEDVLGYRVFKTYDKSFEPVRMYSGHIKDTFLVDTLSLKEPYNKIYYSIAAIDYMANPSPPSEQFEVKIPDFKPPTNGYFKTYKVSMEGISLTWNKSNAYDLAAMHILRKRIQDQQYDTVLTLRGDSLEVESWVDTTTKSKLTYQYVLISEDEAGLFSEHSKVYTIKQLSKEIILSVKNLEAFVSKENRMVKLVWEYPQHATGFKIYRAKDKEPLQTYQFQDGAKREYYDKQLEPNSTYTYVIVAEIKGGYTSGFSNKVIITY